MDRPVSCNHHTRLETVEHIETVNIGAGQAGLATSYWLRQLERGHVVLERGSRPAPVRSGRWDSFALVTLNSATRMPGAEYDGDQPDGFLSRDVISWLEQIGFFELTHEQMPPRSTKLDSIPHVSGTKGDHLLSLHQFAREA